MLSFVARHRAAVGGLAVLVGTVAFLVIEALAESRYPAFDPVHDPLSRLGEAGAPSRRLWEAGLLVLGATWVLGSAVALSRGRGSRALVAIDLAPVAGLATAALVPLDVNLAIHEAGAFVAFLGGSVAVLANAQNLRSPWREVSVVLGGTALAALSPASAFLIGLVGWGSLERVVVFPLVIAIGLFGAAVLAGATRHGPRSRRARTTTLAIVVGGLIVGISGIGSGLTAGGYEKVVAWLGTLAGRG